MMSNTYKPRNEIVVEVIDEFQERIKDIDFSIEDIVAYVTSLTRVFYWINIESVWGPLGFTWMSQDREKKGYGKFNATTFEFSFIPTIPDGDRITRIVSATFNNFSSNTIIIQKSNWDNLYELEHLVPAGKSITADFTGAPITKITELFDYNGKYLYIKADFSNINTESGGYYPNCTSPDKDWVTDVISNSNNMYVFHIDDDNKYSNFPMFNGVILNYYYSGTGPLKLEYLYKENDLKANVGGGRICVTDSNHNYHLIYNDSIATRNSNNSTVSIKDWINTEEFPTEDDIPIELTIDTTYAVDKNIKLCTGLFRKDTLTGNKRYYVNNINIIGEYNQINTFAPAMLIDEQHHWREYNNDNYTNKGVDGMWDKTFYFMPGAYIDFYDKCPYNIDISNCENFNLFFGVRFKFPKVLDNWDRFEPRHMMGNMYGLDILPNIVCDKEINNIELNLLQSFNEGSGSNNKKFVSIVKGNFNCKYFNTNGNQFIFGEDFYLSAYRIDTVGDKMYSIILDSNHPHITIKFSDNEITNIKAFGTYRGHCYWDGTEEGDITVDYFRIDNGSEDTNSINNILNNTGEVCTLVAAPYPTNTISDNLFYGRINYIVKHPIIITNSDYDLDAFKYVSDECPLIVIKNAQSGTVISTDEMFDVFMSKMYPNLYPFDTNTDGTNKTNYKLNFAHTQYLKLAAIEGAVDYLINTIHINIVDVI